MTNLARYTSADLPQLMDRITRNSIGMDQYFDRLFNLHETSSNYPPYNLVHVSNVESRLELALAGFRKKEVNVYTQDGKLFVEGQKEDKETETCTKVWLNGVLLERGHSLMTRKLDRLILRMGF
jgi:molecular chaperone IbpA